MAGVLIQPSVKYFEPSDACDFWFNTPFETIWSKCDFTAFGNYYKCYITPYFIDYLQDSVYHFGLQSLAELINAYPNAQVLLVHWKFVDSLDFAPFTGDSDKLKESCHKPGTLSCAGLGKPFILKRLNKNKLEYIIQVIKKATVKKTSKRELCRLIL